MPQSPNSLGPCTHDLRPGTTVCLHCRRDERLIAQARRQRAALYGGALLMAGIILIGGVAAAAVSVRGHVAGHATPSRMQDASRAAPPQVSRTTRPVGAGPPPGSTMNASVTPSVARDRSRTPPLVPVLARGDTRLADGVTATRTDDGVTVSFDAALIRTRRADKFEHLVRTTLPSIYGPGIDSLLASVPEGAIVSQGNLLTVLPARGRDSPLLEAGCSRSGPRRVRDATVRS